MADYPVLPVYVRDLLGDTSHLSPEEFGAYCRIFMTMCVWLVTTASASRVSTCMCPDGWPCN